MKKIGLIINPIAGLGGPAGLKGSDHENVYEYATNLGIESNASNRAKEAIQSIRLLDEIYFMTGSGQLGEDALKELNVKHKLVHTAEAVTTSADTTALVQHLIKEGVELIVFAGGDGTARDVLDAQQTNQIPVVGIPAGVKIHSACYAISPPHVGEIIDSFIQGTSVLKEVEVMDIDEELFRKNIVNTRLFGYVNVPSHRSSFQSVKIGSGAGRPNLNGVVADVIDKMEEDAIYIIGPGTTTRSIMEKLALQNTLLGIDIIQNKQLITSDANEIEIWNLIQASKYPIYLILTPIGGQGHILGRGNQQISPRIVSKVTKDRMIIIADKEKIYQLAHFQLFVDTGDTDLNKALSGYIKVTTGYKDYLICKIKH